jgi:hypothetical protein
MMLTRMPMIATTISSSMSENPRWVRSVLDISSPTRITRSTGGRGSEKIRLRETAENRFYYDRDGSANRREGPESVQTRR